MRSGGRCACDESITIRVILSSCMMTMKTIMTMTTMVTMMTVMTSMTMMTIMNMMTLMIMIGRKFSSDNSYLVIKVIL